MKKTIWRIVLFIIIFTCLMFSNNVICGASNVYVESDQYLISETQSYIGRILPRTSVEQFKSGFNVDEDTVHIYKDSSLQEEVKTGYVATNMIVKFDNVEKQYVTSVVGDFNSDGLSNQIEITQLIKHIIGLQGSELTGIKLLCADINNDDKVNQIDLTVLINYVVYGRLNIGKIQKPKSPMIEVISGQISNAGWYITLPTIKITETEKENVEKTTYTIDGHTYVEETDIQDDGIIEFKEDGVYKIRSYTYSKKGQRSDATIITIKIRAGEISESNIGLEMRLNDKNGNIYEDNTWTNQNVYIKPIETKESIDGELELSLNLTYTVKGDTVITDETTGEMVISNEGISTVVLTATDETGKTRTKEFTIKIDKTRPENSNLNIETLKLSNGYYNKDVEILIEHGNDNLSGINKVTYELSGMQIQEETEIADNGQIVINRDGDIKVLVKTYDNAGNINEIEQTIKRDATIPTNLNVNITEKTGTGFKITAKATDATSGIAKYGFYIDGSLYEEIRSSDETVSCIATNQSSASHIVEVRVTDNAENTATTQVQMDMEMIEVNQIEYVEFVVNNISQTNSSDNAISEDEFIISDNGISDGTKYIQVENKDNGATLQASGYIRLVRKDGIVINDLKYFPDNLVFMIGLYINGSGTTWKHSSNAGMFDEVVTNEDWDENNTINRSINITGKKNSNNTFVLKDEKESGVKTYSRLVIQEIKENDTKIPFKIVKELV